MKILDFSIFQLIRIENDFLGSGKNEDYKKQILGNKLRKNTLNNNLIYLSSLYFIFLFFFMFFWFVIQNFRKRVFNYFRAQ